MKTINVEELPEPIARALESMVETLKAQLRPVDDQGTRRRAVFQTKPGRALTSLRREDIYGDAPGSGTKKPTSEGLIRGS